MQTPETGLPVKRKLTIVYIMSIIIALLMAGTSIAGLVYQNQFYSPEMKLNTLIDMFNLGINLPVLLITMWLASRKKLMGLLLWLGMLMSILYTFFGNLLSLPFNALYLPNLLIVTLCTYTAIALGTSIDGEAVRQRLSDRVPQRVCAGILLVLVAYNTIRQLSMATMAIIENGHADITWIVDILVLIPPMLITGIQLWRNKALGYLGASGVSLAYGLLVLSAMPFVLIDPEMTRLQVDVAGVIILTVMVLFCLVPMFFFIRAASGHRTAAEAATAD
jgi:hypothetical protein